MRIAHVDTERTWRGGEQQVFSLIQGLKKRGYDNLIVARRGSELAQRAKSLAPVMEVRPVGEWDFVTAHFVNRRFKKERVDIVHAHTSHGAALAALSTLGTNIPVVVTRRVDFHLSRNVFSRWKYNRATRIVAISQGVKRILVEDGVPNEKISVVPSGVDFNRYTSVRALTKQDLGIPSAAPLVGQVAALAPHKDQRTLLAAIALLRKALPNVRLAIVGEGPCRADLEKEIIRLELQNTVQLLGFRENPLDFIPAFDVFCLSSNEEGLGTSLLDAMALRVPVVATAVGGIPELIEHEKTGLLARPEDPEALAEMLSRCLAGGADRPVMVARAAEKAKNFDILGTVVRMDDIYQQLSTGLST